MYETNKNAININVKCKRTSGGGETISTLIYTPRAKKGGATQPPNIYNIFFVTIGY